MCGIVGLLPASPQSTGHDSVQVVQRMAAQIQTRGPDDSGVWRDPDTGTTLGHRRLAIMDLSPLGHQPMASHNGRFQIVFNGEIYNHHELRAQLTGVTWRSQSDTETLLAAIAAWGVPKTLQSLVGMFAFAVWDLERRVLTLARDRMGEKPLYWGQLPGGDTVFASELKALRAHPRWQGTVDRNALALLLRHNAIAAPYTIHTGIHKLRPGHWLELRADGSHTEAVYWDLPGVARQQRSNSTELSDAAATDRLEQLLSNAVRGQLMADVPLGAFLSGGVDSSVVVAMMQRHATQPVRTFAVGFDEEGFDEAQHARAVAKHLGTNHTELYVSASDALAVIPRLPSLYDEPFADSSQIPTFLICQMARQHVTVALSGDGGDELFAGYTRYQMTQRLWRSLARVPQPLRAAAAKAVLALPPALWDSLLLAPLALLGRSVTLAGERAHKFAETVLPAADCAAMYRSLVSHWHDPASVVLGSQEPPTLLQDKRVMTAFDHPVDTMCLADMLTYLPDDILTKVDRAAMGVSLETRVPLLDHRLVEFSWQLPLHQKLRNGTSKWLLREVLYRHVPRALIERPKQGFGVPLAAWLRGPLRDWAENLLSASRLAADGYFDVAQVRARWADHQSGRRNCHYLLWDILMFQAWLDEVARVKTANTTFYEHQSTHAHPGHIGSVAKELGESAPARSEGRREVFVRG